LTTTGLYSSSKEQQYHKTDRQRDSPNGGSSRKRGKGRIGDNKSNNVKRPASEMLKDAPGQVEYGVGTALVQVAANLSRIAEQERPTDDLGRCPRSILETTVPYRHWAPRCNGGRLCLRAPLTTWSNGQKASIWCLIPSQKVVQNAECLSRLRAK
jgi:hypothetical protein